MLKKWINTPKAYMIGFMLFNLLIGSIGYKSLMGIKNALIAILVTVLLDIVLNIFKKRKWTMIDGAVITGLIIALIQSTTTPKTVIVMTGIIAIISKHLIIYKKKPIFNPAAFGLLISGLIFNTGQSWWGAFGDLSVATIIFLLIGGYLIANKIHKFPQVFAFLGTSFILFALMGYYNIGDAVDALRPPFINATLFFGFYMLTDPPTSPAKDKNQVIFGVLSAIAGTIIYALFGGLIYLFIGLCFGNLYAYSVKKSKINIKRTSSTRTTRYARNHF